MNVTYKTHRGLEINTDDEEYHTPHLHRSKFLNYGSSVIKDKSFANGHFKLDQNNDAPYDSYKYDINDFDMIKVAADKRAHPGLNNIYI